MQTSQKSWHAIALSYLLPPAAHVEPHHPGTARHRNAPVLQCTDADLGAPKPELSKRASGILALAERQKVSLEQLEVLMNRKYVLLPLNSFTESRAGLQTRGVYGGLRLVARL